MKKDHKTHDDLCDIFITTQGTGRKG
ncbi:Protein of unknown function [Bacillus mycoides]|nr:Protein of unknown function [Bacillus mycoides]